MPKHAHVLPYLNVVLHGSYEERTHGTSRTCQPHSVIFRPAGEQHSTTISAGGARCLIFPLDPQLMRRVQSRLPGLPLVSRDLGVLGSAGRWAGARLARALLSRSAQRPLDLELLLLELLMTHQTPVASAWRKRSPPWLPRVLELVHAGMPDPINVAILARAVDVHPVHLGRVFHRHVGTTLPKYICTLRVEEVCQALRQGARSISNVAHAVGFADHSHLARAFRRVTGFTPSQYRRVFGPRSMLETF